MIKSLILVFPLLTLNFSPQISESNKINEIIITNPAPDCFEDFMDTWFIEFHQMQNNGHDMNSADRGAAKEAMQVLDACQE